MEVSTADRLLKVAANLFRRKGYALSTTRELADLLGINKASLYYHISGKEDLLFAICQESLQRIRDDVGTVARLEPPEVRLQAMVKTHVKSALLDRDMHAVMLSELHSLSPDLRGQVIGLRDAYERLLRDAILDDQRAGRLRDDVDAKYLTLALLNLLNWTIFWFDPKGDMDAGQLGTFLASIFFQGARAQDS